MGAPETAVQFALGPSEVVDSSVNPAASAAQDIITLVALRAAVIVGFTVTGNTLTNCNPLMAVFWVAGVAVSVNEPSVAGLMASYNT